MNITPEIAKHFRQVYTGGNWTDSDLKMHLSDVTWEEAIQKIGSLNTIVALVYHINYYVAIMVKVLEGGPLEGSDKFSFGHPPVASAEDWTKMLDELFSNGEKFASLVEKLPDSKLHEHFYAEKHGSYYRNLNGVIEHTHYHLGQIAIIKKLLRSQ